MAAEDISFELERFEWASPDRLEVEGTWHGVRRRLPRATLVVEVDGERRRLRALPGESPGSSERWAAAFPWEGEMLRLPGAELEVGRGIVVDLPRPRRSKVGALVAAAPLPATSREERESVPGREEADRLLAVLAAARAEADRAMERLTAAEARAEAAEAELAAADVAGLRARAEAAEGEVEALRVRAEEADVLRVRAEEADVLRVRVEDAEVEAETLRAHVQEAEAELVSLRGREDEAADVPALRARVDAAEGVAEALRARAQEADTLRARAEEAEAELTALRADAEPAVAPDLERLRVELQTVERERLELRAQLDATAERLAASEAQTHAATAGMAGPRTAAAGGVHSDTQEGPVGPFGRGGEGEEHPRALRRPAERTARSAGNGDEEPDEPPSTRRFPEWVTALTGARPEPQNGQPTETEKAPAAVRADRPRGSRAGEPGSAARARRRSDSRAAVEREHPSWLLRVVAVGLLALLMLALVVIVLSLL